MSVEVIYCKVLMNFNERNISNNFIGAFDLWSVQVIGDSYPVVFSHHLSFCAC